MKILKDTPVTVTIGDKEFTKTYDKVIYENADDVLKLMENEKSLKEMISNLNYGSDLKAKSVVRNAILAAEAGPDKAFEKSVKDFMKLRETIGKPVTEERAREIVKAQMDA